MPLSFKEQLVVFYTQESVVIAQGYLTLFLLLFVTALLLKYFTEIVLGYPFQVARGGYYYSTYIAPLKYRKFAQLVYLATFHLRVIFLTALLFGIYPRLAILFLAVSYAAEVLCFIRNHTVITMVIMLVLSLDSSFTDNIYISNLLYRSINELNNSYATQAYGVLYIKYLIMVVYLASALRKIRRGFYSGVVLAEGAKFVCYATGRKYTDHLPITKKILDLLFPRYAVMCSWLVIIAQILIPILLVSGGLFTYCGITLAIMLHLAMSLQFPIAILPFSCIMIATQVLWL